MNYKNQLWYGIGTIVILVGIGGLLTANIFTILFSLVCFYCGGNIIRDTRNHAVAK